MNLLLSKQEERVRDVKVGGCHGCSVHEMVELKISRGREQGKKTGSYPLAAGEQSLACSGTRKNTEIVPSCAGIGLRRPKPGEEYER